MRKLSFRRCWLVPGVLTAVCLVTGCSTVGGTAADLGLAGAGGAVGYEVSNHRIGGAAAGAAAGLLASKVAQSEVRRSVQEAEQRGYDRAMNQAVKQQYWIIQNQQRRSVEVADVHLTPVVIPETKVNGVIQKAHVEYVRVQQ